MFSVALIGPDGAGKTTLTARLQQSSDIRVKCLYMGINIEASNHALPTSRLIAYFKRRQNTESGVYRCGDDLPPGGVSAKRGLGGWLWATGRLINRLLEEWYRQLLSWGYQIRGYAVVYDRHFLYDFTLDGIDGEKQPADKRLHRRLLENFYPRPHLTIYLDAPAEVLFARKGEKTLKELERRRQAFLQLGYRVKNFVRIDATRPFDLVYAEVSGLIEHGYRNKHANAVHWLRLQSQRLGRLLNLPRRDMDYRNSKASEHSGKVDFDIHGVVGIRLIDPSPSDLKAVSKLLGCPSRLPRTEPDSTLRFVENLPVCGLRFLGTDQDAFTDDGFFLLHEGNRRVRAQIPFDQIGEPCEIVCKSGLGSAPLLIPVINLIALKRGYIPLHASAVVYNGVGLLIAGWAHCGKTAALLGFASKGAEYIGEEWVLLSGNGQRMQGLVRPLKLSHRHVASQPHLRSAVSLLNRCAFHGIGLLDGLQKKVTIERTRISPVFRSLQRASAGVQDLLRLSVTPSAIFGERIRSKGAQVDKIFLFVSQEDHKIEVQPIAPVEMARRLAFLVQHELTPLLQHYAAYRFAFPSQRNELIERMNEYTFGILARALNGKETYVVRLPYPHVFSELYKTIQPFCKPPTAVDAGREGAESRSFEEARTEQLQPKAAY